MYFDSQPCQVCGAEVELKARDADDADRTRAEADATVDERVCTNADCPTRRGEGTP